MSSFLSSVLEIHLSSKHSLIITVPGAWNKAVDTSALRGARSIGPKTDLEPVITNVMTVWPVLVVSVSSILDCSYKSADFIPS